MANAHDVVVEPIAARRFHPVTSPDPAGLGAALRAAPNPLALRTKMQASQQAAGTDDA